MEVEGQIVSPRLLINSISRLDLNSQNGKLQKYVAGLGIEIYRSGSGVRPLSNCTAWPGMKSTAVPVYKIPDYHNDLKYWDR